MLETDMIHAPELLAAENLSIGYSSGRKRTMIATDLSLKINEGEVICLIGQNGVGKSTLLRTLAGAQPPLAGLIYIGDKELKSFSKRDLAKKLSLVLTERVEPEGFTVEDIVALGRFPHTNWRGCLDAGDKKVLKDSLSAVGGEYLAKRPFSNLSDGERQKVMIARALAQQTQLMLLDEPTAFLDLLRRVEILKILSEIVSVQKKGILMAIHDISLALEFASRIWILGEGGRMIQGSPEDLVISGEIERAFSSSDLLFDPMWGKYSRPVARTEGPVIAIQGEGRAVYWTARSLRRHGFKVCSSEMKGAAMVKIERTQDGYIWHVFAGSEQKSKHESVHSLVNYLERFFNLSA